MNIVLLHNAVYNWLDKVGTPRFTSDRIDAVLNGIINEIVDENYDRFKGNPNVYFESNSRIRNILINLEKKFYNTNSLRLINTSSTAGAPDGGSIFFRYGNDFAEVDITYSAAVIQTQIRTIDGLSTATVTGDWASGFIITLLPVTDNKYYNEFVVDSSTLVDSNGISLEPKIVRNYNSDRVQGSEASYDPYFIRRDELPSDWRCTLKGRVNIAGTVYDLKNIDLIDENQLNENPFKIPSINYPERQFYKDRGEGIFILAGTSSNIYGLEFDYLKNPDQVSFGTEHTYEDTGIIVTKKGIVTSLTATIDSVDYVLGDEISFTSIDLTAGTVTYGYTNTDLGESLHEDIAFRSAIALLTKIGDTEKASILAGLRN